MAVLDEANILLRTAGVTGIRPFEEAGGERGTFLYECLPLSEEVTEGGIVASSD